MAKRNFGVMTNLASIVIFAAILLAFSLSSAAAEATLQLSDCIKCHQKEPLTIESVNSKHKTKVTCLDCHLEHPPLGKNAIPQCSMCHDPAVKKHFTLENCLSCHSDPHKPLALNLAADITEPCLTCHDAQGQEFRQYQSRHAEQSCTFCHDVHGKLPECTQCHEPHIQGQITINCLECHKPHHPREVVPPETVPRSACVACHDAIGALMSQTTTKHQTFTCSFCHSKNHPFVPKCTDCHDTPPHSAKIHKQFPNCLDCHLDAHNLVK